MYNNSFIFSFPNYITFISFFLPYCPKILSTKQKGNHDSRHPYFLSSICGNAFNISALIVMFTVGVLQILFIELSKFSSIHCQLRVLSMNVLNFIENFFVSVKIILLFISFTLCIQVEHINLFSNTKPNLPFLNKSKFYTVKL